ncbi:MAG: hypothetical protein HY060_13325 [Proteobacteria bacterium]|nr:hypothetical protein [Pseudomonadota bacterium]
MLAITKTRISDGKGSDPIGNAAAATSAPTRAKQRTMLGYGDDDEQAKRFAVPG